MKARDKILANIKISTESRNETIGVFDYTFDKKNMLEKFQKSLESVAAKHYLFKEFDEVEEIVNSYFPEYKSCANTINEINIEGLDLSNINNSKDLHPLDLSIIKGEFGVAENGSIWVNVGVLPDRTIPFLCENLIIVVRANSILSDMHEAYAKTDTANYEYGVFITGPSKTADIEQTLVVGAQGPRKMLVLIKS